MCVCVCESGVGAEFKCVGHRMRPNFIRGLRWHSSKQLAGVWGSRRVGWRLRRVEQSGGVGSVGWGSVEVYRECKDGE